MQILKNGDFGTKGVLMLCTHSDESENFYTQFRPWTVGRKNSMFCWDSKEEE